MNFFSSIPSTCYIYLAYYPREEKEHRFTSTQKKKQRIRERKKKEKKRKEEAGNLFSCADGRCVVLSNSRLSLSIRVHAGVSIDKLAKTNKDK